MAARCSALYLERGSGGLTPPGPGLRPVLFPSLFSLVPQPQDRASRERPRGTNLVQCEITLLIAFDRERSLKHSTDTLFSVRERTRVIAKDRLIINLLQFESPTVNH